jgi:diacylglycerol kinase family enzyme
MNQQTLSETTTLPRSSTARIRRAEAVVNIAGGSVETRAAEGLEALVSEFGLEVHVASAEPRDIEATVRRAVSADPDLVIILAGDGTARLAAQLCGPDGPLVAPLPGGTMNVLPNALYNGLSWRDALKAALNEGKIRPVAGGEAEGRSFYVSALLGAPALWAPAREAVRNMDLRTAWSRARRAMLHAFSRKLHFALDHGPALKTEALAVMCPMVSRVCSDESAFEAAALDPEGAADAFRLGLNMLRGDWRIDPSVSTERCLHAHAWASRPIPCLLDGELQMLERKVEFAFKPTAFRALVPSNEGKLRNDTKAGVNDRK